MRADGWPSWLLAALAAVLVGAGLWATGGPAAGRAERRDAVRQADVAAIHNVLVCADQAGADLPATLDGLDDPDEFCGPAPRRADPFTGAPYAYERRDARSYQLCATFERPDLLVPYAYDGEAFDPTTGCTDATLPPPVPPVGGT